MRCTIIRPNLSLIASNAICPLLLVALPFTIAFSMGCKFDLSTTVIVWASILKQAMLVINKSNIFSIIYKKKEEESRIDFYTNKENSNDKKSLCECKITDSSGKDRTIKGYTDINPDNVLDILIDFFDYSDLEKSDNNRVDIFLMGFTKSIKAVLKSEEKDQLPPSFNIFMKYLKDISGKSMDPSVDKEDYSFMNIVKKFITYMKSNS